MIVAKRVARENWKRDSGQHSRQVIRIDVSTGFHHGEGIEFGPEGCLHIGMRGRRAAGGPFRRGQNLQGVGAGKFLRSDVDRRVRGRLLCAARESFC